MGMLFVRTAAQFYTMRFLLGLAPFVGEDAYKLAARLRFRVGGGHRAIYIVGTQNFAPHGHARIPRQAGTHRDRGRG